jgi:hypothetical protein
MTATAEPARLSIRDILGSGTWVSSSDGQKVFDAAIAHLLEGRALQVSFRGREHVITAFLNVAIGQLYAGRVDWNDLDERLAFTDLDAGDREKVDMVIDNAKRYFVARAQRQSL